MDKPQLKKKLRKVPLCPGVYLMKNDQGVVIYVGKAKILRNRVRSYFQSLLLKDIKTRLLVSDIREFDWIVTDTEKEALILENTLIKKYRPHYNIRLRDDKNYPCLRMSHEDFPRLSVVRKIQKDGAIYFGPFSNVRAVRTTMRFLNKHFPLRKCTDHKFVRRTSPCIMHQIGQCEAPCVGKINKTDYAKIVRQVKHFFDGKAELLTKEMTQRMEEHSEAMQFEKAARYRDAIRAILATTEKQKIVGGDFTNRDVFNLYREGGSAVVSVLYLRKGQIFGHRAFPVSGMELPDMEIINAVIKQYYGRENLVPKEILVPGEMGEEQPVIEQWLSDMSGHVAKIFSPVRGRKKELVELAGQNAKTQFEVRRNKLKNTQETLEKIQRRLHLRNLPFTIECYDISNLQGTNQVAASIRFEEGEPDKSGYRKYKIRTVEGQDDFASMHEVLSRRFAKNKTDLPWPNLILIDGGKGQLSMALKALEELDVQGPDVVAFTKVRNHKTDEPEDMAYLPGRKNPVRFRKGGDDLFLLQRVRDESHRFAIEFHRKLRGKSMKKSALDEVPGIGPAKKKALFKRFSSISKIAAAKPDTLAEIPGITVALAEKIIETLNKE